ncbi:MAG: hypothetical protein GY880_31650 [Planctomycetaceae bacterium]|nr:hypothetical protein [Planctomycetaceae bacterium]
MVVYENLKLELLKVFDKGIDKPENTSGDFADFQLPYRSGGTCSLFI